MFLDEKKEVLYKMTDFKLEYNTEEEIRENIIPTCQKEDHVQQVAFSTFHDGMTQVCFDCKKIRTTIMRIDNPDYGEEEKKEFVKLDEEMAEKIRDTLEGKELIEEDDMKVLKNKRKTIGTKNDDLAKLFIKCHDNIKNNLHELKLEEEDDNKKLKDYVSQYDVDEIRNLVSKYGDGENLGDFYTEEKISANVKKHRKEYEDLINNFFKIFGEEM